MASSHRFTGDGFAQRTDGIGFAFLSKPIWLSLHLQEVNPVDSAARLRHQPTE